MQSAPGIINSTSSRLFRLPAEKYAIDAITEEFKNLIETGDTLGLESKSNYYKHLKMAFNSWEIQVSEQKASNASKPLKLKLGATERKIQCLRELEEIETKNAQSLANHVRRMEQLQREKQDISIRKDEIIAIAYADKFDELHKEGKIQLDRLDRIEDINHKIKQASCFCFNLCLRDNAEIKRLRKEKEQAIKDWKDLKKNLEAVKQIALKQLDEENTEITRKQALLTETPPPQISTVDLRAEKAMIEALITTARIRHFNALSGEATLNIIKMAHLLDYLIQDLTQLKKPKASPTSPEPKKLNLSFARKPKPEEKQLQPREIEIYIDQVQRVKKAFEEASGDLNHCPQIFNRKQLRFLVSKFDGNYKYLSEREKEKFLTTPLGNLDNVITNRILAVDITPRISPIDTTVRQLVEQYSPMPALSLPTAARAFTH